MKAAVLYGNEDLRYDDYPTPEVTPGTVKVKVRLPESAVPMCLGCFTMEPISIPLCWATSFPAM